MAISSRSSNRWGFSLKALGLSTLAVTIALLVKLSVPLVSQFVVYDVPLLWGCIVSWLTPPYLYIVINGIIITIAASSRFHQKVDEAQTGNLVAPLKVAPPMESHSHSHPPLDFSVYDSVLMKTTPVQVRAEFGIYETELKNNTEGAVEEIPNEVVVENNVPGVVVVNKEEEEGFSISRSTWTPTPRDSTQIPLLLEKPPVSVRFSHRRTSKQTPEGAKALGVAKPKRGDTLNSTWKTITDGRPIPLARHLKKSDTWDAHGRHQHNIAAEDAVVASSPKMKKSETFKDRSSCSSPLSQSPGSGKLKRDVSLGQDELNRRVEAFIKKFNQEMRLQRQESLNQYKEMVGGC